MSVEMSFYVSVAFINVWIAASVCPTVETGEKILNTKIL